MRKTKYFSFILSFLLMSFVIQSDLKFKIIQQSDLNKIIQKNKKDIKIINFWATWCPPCVSEMPELVALQTELADKNLQIIGIGIDSPSNIREFSSTHHITYPLLVAGMNGTELARQFGNQAGGLPFTVLINPQGQVRKVYLGRLDMKKLREDLLSPQ